MIGIHDLRRADGWARLVIIVGPRECVWSQKGRLIRIWGMDCAFDLGRASELLFLAHERPI